MSNPKLKDMSKVVLVVEVYPSALSGAQTVLECRNQSFFFLYCYGGGKLEAIGLAVF